MSPRIRKRKPKPRKKRNFISTDAALLTATFLMVPFELIDQEEFVKSILGPFLQSPRGTTVFSLHKVNSSYEKALPPACEHAADFLSRVLFAENMFKRLDFNDPKHVVTLVYCALRLGTSNSKSAKKVIDDDWKTQFGKYWWWPVVWHISALYKVVRARGEMELAKGEAALRDWQNQCQKFANNFWIEEKKKSKQIASRKKAMIESLKRHPIAQKLIK